MLLVAFEGMSEEETEAKVERRTTETMVGRVAVMEMVMEGCAAVRVMREGVTEREMLEDDAVDGEKQVGEEWKFVLIIVLTVHCHH